MNQQRLLIINDMLWGGGRERRISQLIIGLRKQTNLEICLVLLDEGIDYPEVIETGIEIKIIKRSSNRDLSVFRKLNRIFKEFQPTVAMPWSLMSAAYTCPIAVWRGIPVVSAHVVDCNAPIFGTVNWAAAHVAKLLSEKVVSNTNAGHEAYDIPVKKRVTIRNGFDFARKSNQPPRQLQLSTPPRQSTTIAMIGRIDPSKDYSTFISGLKALRNKHKSFNALCIGKGPDLEPLREQLASDQIDYIQFTGFLSPIEPILPQISIGVLCTNAESHTEGIPNALLEMMAFGIPVIATRGGGTDELISHQVDGFLIAPGNATELAFWLSKLIEDEPLRDQIGTNAIKKIQREYSLSSMCEAFLTVISELQDE